MREGKNVLLLLAACFVVTPLLFAEFDFPAGGPYSYGNIDVRFEHVVSVPPDVFARSVKKIVAENGFVRGGANGLIGSCTIIVLSAPPNMKMISFDDREADRPSWFSYSCRSFGREQGYPEILVSGSAVTGKEFSESFADFSHKAGIATKRIR